MDPDGGHLRQQDEVPGETMAMAAAAAAAAASGTGTVGEKGKGKRIWVADEEPSNLTDDLMLDVDGDDLIFPDEAFSCLADFPCLASPPESPLSSSACDRFKHTNLASSSSSSSSSNWSLLFGPTGGLSGGADAQAVASSSVDAMMLPPLPPTCDQLSIELEGLDALGDIDLDLSEPWGTASPTPDNMIIEDGATTASMSGEESPPRLHVMAGEERPPGGVGVEGGAATGSPMAVPEEEYSKEMVRVFFEWLRINRDTISLQDLREIRLKRATIDCAERRLGGNRRGRVQLLKLILAWVQASLLQKKKRRKSQNERQDRAEGAAPPYAHHHEPPPPFAAPPRHHVPVLSSNVLADPNPNLDYSSQSNGWIPYQVDPTTGAVFPVLMPAYGGAGGGIISGGDLAYPGAAAAAAAAPYSYQHGSTSIIAVNYQPFPPSPDLHAVDDTTAAWPPPYAAAPVQYVAFPGATGPHPAPVPQMQYSRGYANRYPGHPRLGGLGSATKEARKRRMARQRRASSLHHHRNQLQQKHHKAESRSSRTPAEGASSSSSNANDARAWSFWSSPSSSRQKNPVTESPPPPKSPMQQPQPKPSTPRQRQNSHGDEASTAVRQQVGFQQHSFHCFLFFFA